MTQLTIAEEFQRIKVLANKTGDERVKELISFVEKIVDTPSEEQSQAMVAHALYFTEELFRKVNIDDPRFRYFQRWFHDAQRSLMELSYAIGIENTAEIHSQRAAVMGTIYNRVLNYC